MLMREFRSVPQKTLTLLLSALREFNPELRYVGFANGHDFEYIDRFNPSCLISPAFQTENNS